jgi:hypothetical protein
MNAVRTFVRALSSSGAIADPSVQMPRIAPGLVVVLTTLLAASPGAVAARPAAKCKPKHACESVKPAKKPAKPSKPKKPSANTGWHNGIYDGGPGDPIIAPL